jgi:hypothetical protein
VIASPPRVTSARAFVVTAAPESTFGASRIGAVRVIVASGWRRVSRLIATWGVFCPAAVPSSVKVVPTMPGVDPVRQLHDPITGMR